MPKTKGLFTFYLLSFTWGIITTLLGLIILLCVKVFFSRKIEVKIVAGRIFVKFLKVRFGGFSMGIVYFVDASNSKRIHLHELGHSIQNIYFGPLFLFLIAIPSMIRYHYRNYIRKTDHEKFKTFPPYDSIWFEGQATKLGYANFENLIDQFLLEGK
jgi:hypothetical protein